MFKHLICWLGDILFQDWHEWTTLYTHQSEYNPDLIYEIQKCNNCGERRSITQQKDLK